MADPTSEKSPAAVPENPPASPGTAGGAPAARPGDGEAGTQNPAPSPGPAVSGPTPEQIENARRRAAEILAAREKAAPAEKVAGAPSVKASRAAAEKDPRTDVVLTRDLGASLAAVVRIIGLVAKVFGRTVEPLSQAEQDEGGRAFLALARRMNWIARLSVWLAIPAWLINVVVNRRKGGQAEKTLVA